MKKELHQESIELLKKLKNCYYLTQKEIAERIAISQVDISKAKNKKPESWNEIGVDRWKEINSSLKLLLLSLSPKEPTPYVTQIPLKHGLKNLTAYGALSGVFSCFITILLREYVGYDNITSKNFHQILPVMFLGHIFIGAFMGYSCFKFSNKILKNPKNKTLDLITLLLIAFTLITVFRGLKARDSYFMSIFSSYNPKGLLGEPNFEVLGTSLAFTLCIYFIVRYLVVKKRYSGTDLLNYSLATSLISTFSFTLVFILFKILIHFNIVVEKGYIISPSVFKFSFSHPERVPWIWLVTFASTYLILYKVRSLALEEVREKMII